MKISEEFLEVYDLEQLSGIAEKIGCSFIGGGIREYYKREIKKRYDINFEKVINRFERENNDLLNNIKVYMVDPTLVKEYIQDIENTLIKWGIYNGNSLEPNISDFLKERYRSQFIKEGLHNKNYDKYPLYTRILIFMYDMIKIPLKEQDKVIEKFINRNKEISDLIIKFLKDEKFIEQNYRKKSSKVKVNDILFNELAVNNNLLDFYKKCYGLLLESLGCKNWLEYVFKIGALQQKNDTWVNNDVLQLVNSSYIKTMYEYGIINETVVNGIKFIALTSFGISLYKNEIVDFWPGSLYRIDEKEYSFLAYNDNPIIILNNLVKNKLVCKENLLEFKLIT